MVPWILAQSISKKAAGLREASDINGGHYVSRIARNLGYFTPNETKKCSAVVEGTLLDKKALKGILDNSKMRIKENDVEKRVVNRKIKRVRKVTKLRRKVGYTFASDYNPPMVPPYPYSTTPFTSMENTPNAVVEHVEELMRYFAFGRHLEEIHVTWAYLEKKRTRLRTYTNIAQEFLYSGWRRRHKYNVTIPESLYKIERGVKKDIEPMAPTMIVNRLVLEWEERIKLHLEREMEFDQWKSKNFKGKHPALVKVEGGIDDEGEVT
ncbi:hypothetical protein Tco_0003584 [Tanacetum coccineum]